MLRRNYATDVITPPDPRNARRNELMLKSTLHLRQRCPRILCAAYSSEQTPRLPVMGDYRLQIRRDLRWGDQDLFGHVNNVKIIQLFEEGRTMYLERLADESGMQALKNPAPVKAIGIIVANVTCNFLLPLKAPGWVTTCASISHLMRKRRRFAMQHAVFNQDGKLAAYGALSSRLSRRHLIGLQGLEMWLCSIMPHKRLL
jgi:acyl-CoA thioesterase FadM